MPVIEKKIVYRSRASAKAWRNEPEPLSLVFVTTMVEGRMCGVGRGRGVGCGLSPDSAEDTDTVTNIIATQQIPHALAFISVCDLTIIQAGRSRQFTTRASPSNEM